MTKAAKEAGVTVDQLVQAGLGRQIPDLPEVRGQQTAAHIAAEELAAKHRGVFGRLSAWPFVCRFCGADVRNVRGMRTCPLCSKAGCEACVVGAKCPSCVALAKERKLEASRRRKLVSQ
jgi:hypothetical protein